VARMSLALATGDFAVRPALTFVGLDHIGQGRQLGLLWAVLGAKPSHYWRWSGTTGEPTPYRNAIPHELVEIFERHGFIWGGKWYHYDTMHFEYRPELLVTSP